jgi:hypothetical protein
MNDNDGGTATSYPQEKTTLKKRRFTVQDKLCLVRRVQKRIDADKVSIRTACSDVNISHKMYLDWTKQLHALNETKKELEGEKSLHWPCIDFEAN